MQAQIIYELLPFLHVVNYVLFQRNAQSSDDNASGNILHPSVPRNRSDEPHIGKYRLIKTIGKGNFAKVKLAKHVPTGKEVFCLMYCLYLLSLRPSTSVCLHYCRNSKYIFLVFA